MICLQINGESLGVEVCRVVQTNGNGILDVDAENGQLLPNRISGLYRSGHFVSWESLANISTYVKVKQMKAKCTWGEANVQSHQIG